jgi:hypothetical protein
VYGDDIIVPTEMATSTMVTLETFGLRVNHSKSYCTGFFRESCGGDYYKGVDITPVYCRQWDFTGKLVQPNGLAAYVSMSNQFYMKGLWNVAQYIRNWVDHSRFGPLSRSTVSLGTLTWSSVCFNTGLQWYQGNSGYRVKGPSLYVRHQFDPHNDVLSALYTSFQARSLGSERDCTRQFARTGSYLSRSYRGVRRVSRGSLEGTANASIGASGTFFDDSRRDHRRLETVSGVTGSFQDDLMDLNVPQEFLLHPYSLIESQSEGSTDTNKSVRAYSSKVKSRWTPTPVGLWLKDLSLFPTRVKARV